MDESIFAQPVQSREQLIALVEAMAAKTLADPEAWENPTLACYLEALAAWLTDMAKHREHFGGALEPSWQTFADAIYAAAIYE